jgi:hypothetical protein
VGKAANRKKARRLEAAVDAGKLRIVVCAYPANFLRPVVDLLKAAAIYGDEVLLHSPAAILLSSVASIRGMPATDMLAFVR